MGPGVALARTGRHRAVQMLWGRSVLGVRGQRLWIKSELQRSERRLDCLQRGVGKAEACAVCRKLQPFSGKVATGRLRSTFLFPDGQWGQELRLLGEFNRTPLHLMLVALVVAKGAKSPYCMVTRGQTVCARSLHGR
jgi:hypothetical protein